MYVKLKTIGAFGYSPLRNKALSVDSLDFLIPHRGRPHATNEAKKAFFIAAAIKTGPSSYPMHIIKSAFPDGLINFMVAVGSPINNAIKHTQIVIGACFALHDYERPHLLDE